MVFLIQVKQSVNKEQNEGLIKHKETDPLQMGKNLQCGGLG